ERAERAGSLVDKWGIKRPEHRNGLINWAGGVIERQSTDPSGHLTRPNELHLWTPVYRRRPVGFGVTLKENDKITENEPTIDEEALAARLEEIESRAIPDESVTYDTHTARREAECQRYHGTEPEGHTRPNTSTILVRNGPKGKETIDSFRKLQTSQGIFISAMESSYDWRTSYDFLGPVKCGFHQQFTLSEERETIDEPPEERHNTSQDPIEFDQRYRLLEAVVPVETAGTNVAGSPPKTNNGKEKAGGSKPPKTNNGKEKTGESSQSQKRGRAEDIQYPYGVKDLQDIDGEPKRIKLRNERLDGHLPLVATEWCEETDGRREWHLGMQYHPSSPVDSPPHVPINPVNIDLNTIPADSPDGNFDSIENSKTRCTHIPDRCRAWWKHAPDECWVVKSVQAPRPAIPDPILHPFEKIDLPQDFELSNRGRNIYQQRIGDHYGIMDQGQARWPTVGVRVPYEPMTYDDLKPNNEGDGQADYIVENAANDNDDTTPTLPVITVPGGVNRNAFKVHSLAAPLIPMLPGRAYGPYDDDSPASTDIDSDDDSDLFLASYQECSGIPPPPATTTGGSPTVPEAPGPVST
ncbi:hypothetical protein A1F96_09161, partial [Pyrenophora tritici-repentis]